MTDDIPLQLLDRSVFNKLLRRFDLALSVTLGLCITALLGLILYLLQASKSVERADREMVSARNIEKQLLTMQSGFRGFRLTGDPQYLRGYEHGIEASGIPAKLSQLERRVGDDRDRAWVVAQLRERVRAWFAFVAEELQAVRADPKLTNNPAFLARGVPLFTAVMESLDTFSGKVAALRQQRTAVLQQVVVTVLVSFGIATLLGIPLLTRWVGRLLRTVSQSYQLSLRKSAQQAEELQVTLRSIGDAVVATDANGKVEFLNPVAEGLMGWTQQEAKGKPLPEVFEIFHEHHRAPAENPVDRVLRENVVVGLANHTVLRSRDGREVPIEDSAAPIRSKDGKVKGVILVFHDVTEKQQAARRLGESERRLSFLSELADAIRFLPDTDAIIAQSVDMLGRFLKVSRCAYATVEPETGHFSS